MNDMIKIEDLIKNVIEKIILKRYPVIISVESVEDAFSDLGISHSSFLGWKYIVNLHTSECLDSNIMMEIDTEIKNLFKMMGITSNRTKSPSISSFFNCNDGQGFQFASSYGYNH
jgi:hypothetical protein